MQLLCIGRDLRLGGAERGQLTALRWLDRRRFRISIWYMSPAGSLHRDVAPHLEVQFGSFEAGRRWRAAAGFLRAVAPAAGRSDLIVGLQDGTPIYLALLAGWMTRRPVVAWTHGVWSTLFPRGSWHRPVSRLLYPRARKIICPSPGSAEDLVGALPKQTGSRTVVVPNMIDPKHLRPACPIEAEINEAFAGNGEPLIASCGRLVREKRFDLLILAFADLIRQGHRARLVIAGDGPERHALTRLVDALALKDRVLMPGFLASPYELLRKSAVYVCPSDTESFGLAILEALWLGLPVIATDATGGGPRYLLEGGRWGILLGRGDSPSLTKAIVEVLVRKELAAELRKRSRARATEFLPDRIIPLLESVLLDSVR